ncbi:MAG TPA: DegT/DnrJ/EryC1/StrS family aminotransferase [Jatrophihabitans sp.]|nr:DegT/DnrJ/EryC1/StrS family aminotransferase [Jatrophihabitans sp.]
MNRINVMKPWLDEEEIASVADVIGSGWVAQGPRVAAFEEKFAARVGAEHAVAVSSCTTALHLALIAAGVGPGDEVVVPSFSFIATANAPVYVGATPVFADVDEGTGNLTPETVEAVLTPRVRAVILVHQGGVPADAGPIRAVCEPRDIVVVEDAACAVGSRHLGRQVAGDAAIAAWSFHPRKIITTGEGGMITTGNAEWAARVRRLREHAMSVSAAERHRSVLPAAEEYVELGFNFRMTDLQAALGIVQLDRLDAIVARRREIAAAYQRELAGIAGLRAVADPPGGQSNFQSFWIELAAPFPLDREGLLAHLAARNISARRGIMAAHRQPAYKGHATGLLPVTERLTDNTLILPVYHQLTDDERSRVTTAVREAASS